MFRFILALSVILLGSLVWASEIDEAEAAFAFARAKAERLAVCHDGQCVPAIHAAEVAFGLARRTRGQATIPLPKPGEQLDIVVPIPKTVKGVCPSGKCTCGCETTGDCRCPRPASTQPTALVTVIPNSTSPPRTFTVPWYPNATCPNGQCPNQR